jgi:conjugative transfer signal peptidase TraF
MLPCGRLRAPFVAFGVAAFVVSVLAATASALGIRVNTSYSLPLGLYASTEDHEAQLIEFCPKDPYASESASRSYRTPSFACPDGAVPLLKPIVARAGDLVIVSEEGISVNGVPLPRTRPLPFDVNGRPLKAWPRGDYVILTGTVWVASTYNAGSYDSRYMGPIEISQIRRRLRPLWLVRG